VGGCVYETKSQIALPDEPNAREKIPLARCCTFPYEFTNCSSKTQLDPASVRPLKAVLQRKAMSEVFHLARLNLSSWTPVSCLALLAGFTLVSAAEEAQTAAKVEWWDTLRDPTVLSSQAGVEYDYIDQHQGAFRNKLKPSGRYAFGSAGQRDWEVSAELPFYHDEPGDSGGQRDTGVGDLQVGFGHILDGTGRFRWGLGLKATFDTASKPQFGDGAFQLAPIWGGGFRFRPDLELVANLQYNASVSEASGRQPVNSLEFKPALLKRLPHHWYSLLGWNRTWDFENGDLHEGKIKLEFGKGFGKRQQWVIFGGIDVPVVHAGQENFTVKAGLNYVFK
jgi:hypothetical protein